MTKDQATAIIILLAAILLVLLAGRAIATELLGLLGWIAVAVLVAAVALTLLRSLREISHSWFAKRVKDEIEELCREISSFPSP
jgi:hypothetical protein